MVDDINSVQPIASVVDNAKTLLTCIDGSKDIAVATVEDRYASITSAIEDNNNIIGNNAVIFVEEDDNINVAGFEMIQELSLSFKPDATVTLGDTCRCLCHQREVDFQTKLAAELKQLEVMKQEHLEFRRYFEDLKVDKMELQQLIVSLRSCVAAVNEEREEMRRHKQELMTILTRMKQ